MYNGHMEFGISMQTVKLIRTVLKDSYSKACTGKYLCDTFRVQNGLKQECASLSLLSIFV